MIDKVYVIDDDKMVLFIQEKMLNATQFSKSISKFSDGQEALNQLESEVAKEVVVFLDINMPYMNGWEFLEKMEKLSFKTKVNVIMVTSSINPEDEENARSNKFVIDFLVKPVKTEALNQLKTNNTAIKHLFS